MAKRPRANAAPSTPRSPRARRTPTPAQPESSAETTAVHAAERATVKRKPGRPRKTPIAPAVAVDDTPLIAAPSQPESVTPESVTEATLAEIYTVEAASVEPIAAETDAGQGSDPIETYSVEAAPIEAAPVEAAPVEPAEEVEAVTAPLPEIDIGIQAAEDILPVIREDIEAAIEALQASIEIAVDDSTPSVSFEVKAGEIGSIAAERFQALTAQLKERIEMSASNGAKIFEQAGELTKGNVEALVASSHIAAKGFEALGQSAAEYGRKQVEDATAAIKNIAEIKSPTDFFKYQTNFARAAFESMVAESSRIGDAMIKLASDVSEPITARYSDAMKQVKSIGL